MQTPIARVMQSYRMMVNLTAEQEEAARQRLETFLKDCEGSDRELAVQGLQFLRGNRKARNRRARPQAA